jgi:vacuolar protein sorting-associated protein 54
LARRRITIDNRPFKTTGAALMMVKFLVEYVRCALMFPVVAPRAAARLFDTLVLFHETTKRLILGAEVKRLGRLPSIGAKHLALASQSLSVICALLPGIGRILFEAVPVQQRSRVDEERLRVQELFQNHINTISDTMAGLIGAELSQLGDLHVRIDWDARGTEGLERAQPYMIELTDKVAKLHAVLSNHLYPDDIAEVFERVFDLCNERVPELYAKVSPKTPAGKTRVRVDVFHLLSSLRRLPRLHGPGDKLEVWLEQRFGRSGGPAAAAAKPPQ